MSISIIVHLKVLVLFFVCLCYSATVQEVKDDFSASLRRSVCFECSDILKTNPNNECRVPRCNACKKHIQLNATDQNEDSATPSTFPTPVIEHCKEDDEIAVTWTISNSTFYYLSYQKLQGSPFVFETEPTRCGHQLLTNLMPFTTYRIELSSISIPEKGRIIHRRSHPTTVRTHKINRTPSHVPKLHVKEFYLEEDSYTAHIGWKQGADNGCYFNVVSLGGEDEGYQDIDIENVWNNNEVNISRLQFGRNYSISVSGIADIKSDLRIEGPKSWLNITVPTCLQAHNHVKKCAPEQPQNLTVQEKLVDFTGKKGSLLYNVSLRWNEPKYTPNFYLATLISFDTNFTKFNLNVTGDSTSAEFKRILLTPKYEVRLTAFSDFGPGTTSVVSRHFNMTDFISFESESAIPTELIFIIIIPTTVVILGALFIVNYYLEKRAQRRNRDIYFKDIEDKATSNATTVSTISISRHKTDVWEINTIKLIIEDVLGHGAFGVVRRGWYLNDKGNYIEVAIKMLREHAMQEELKQFYQEIEIMKNVPRHPHLVSLIGCVSSEQPLLVVEYCSKGDLQTYLRSAYEKLMKTIMANNNTESAGNTNYAFNKLYDLSHSDLEDLPEPKDLISFARQVALGMEYLASLKLLHRDLAARNVLVCDNKTVKISDFGLSRDVYYDDVYCKLGGGKLPIRWMALESMTHQIYTTQSDVWSFGILLWEIITLGSTPYPGIASQDLLGLLNSGYRMPKPDGCSDELYSIMLDCWKDDPTARPSFLEIRESLDKLLEANSDYLILNEPPSNVADMVHL